MTGYQALARSLRELKCSDRDKIVKLSSAIQTLLNDCSSATYNEHIEQSIPKFDELLLRFSTLVVELATKPDPITDHNDRLNALHALANSSAGINPVPGSEMGEDYAVLGGK